MKTTQIVNIIKNQENILNRINREEDYLYEQLYRLRKLETAFGKNGVIREGESIYKLVNRRESDLVMKIEQLGRERGLAECVLRLYRSLDKQARRVLDYLYLENRSWDWVAVEMDISKTSISRHRTRGLRALHSGVHSYLEDNP
ncbi:MAG: hypothetical protein Q4P30_05715 [Eubacteriales bacterium]|nr:hypothetical protein [Eubacteriales bacterium]